MNYKFNRYKDISFSHLKLKIIKKSWKKSLHLIELKLSQTKRGEKRTQPNLKLSLYKVNIPIR